MNTQTTSKYLLTMILALAALAILSLGVPASAQEANSNGPKIGVGGFLDEDGDGFNDLMPDADGDGVPDALDPDYRNRQSDGTFMREQMNGMGDTTGVRHHEMPGDDDRHPIMRDGMGPHDGMGPGEPGQYGPGDSTGHGGMGGDPRHGGHRGGGDMGGDPDSSDMGGHGGHRPIIDPRHGDENNQNHDDIIRDNNIINSKGNPNNNAQPDGVRDGGK
jgi:hypothetical protein